MYDIGAKDGLLDPKHFQRMGAAVWLFLWCLNRVTKEENGRGYVLGGTPVKYERIQQEVGIPERSYNRWIVLLRNYGYIETQKTSRGLIILVRNSKKRSAKMADENRQSGGATRQSGGTKRHYSRHYNKTLPAEAGKRMKKNQFNYSEDKHSDTYEEVIDMDTGAPAKPAPTVNASGTMRNMLQWAEARRGAKFINYPKQIKALAMMRKAEKTPQQVKDRWCLLETDPYWKDKGFDFMTVANDFNKRP